MYAKAETGPIGSVTIRNCVTFCNGYVLDIAENGSYTLVNADNGNGFKMGGESITGYHSVINSVAFINKAKGICPDISAINCTSFNNNSYNVAFYTNNAVNTDYTAAGVLSYKNIATAQAGESIKLKGTQDSSKVYNALNWFCYGVGNSHNSLDESVTEDWFVSLDSQKVIDAFVRYIVSGVWDTEGIYRNEDGTVNMNSFLELTATAPAEAGAQMSGTASIIVETPDETGTSEDPAEDPTEDPTEDPVEDPTEDPVEDPTEDPVEDPTEDSAEDPEQESAPQIEIVIPWEFSAMNTD